MMEPALDPLIVDFHVVIPVRKHTADLDLLLADLQREAQSTPSTRISVKVVNQHSKSDWMPWIYGVGPAVLIHDPVEIAGAAVNRNRGADQSSANWLVFLDDDVRLEHGWLMALERATNDPQAADLIGGFVGSQRPNNWFSQVAEDCVIRHQKNADGWYLVGAHMIVRRSSFEQLGGFNATLGSAGGEDWDLCSRAHKLGLRVSVDSSIRCLHKNPTNWSDLVRRASSYAVGTVNSASTGSPIANTSVDSSPLPQPKFSRAVMWPIDRYREFRNLGRSRIRSARTVAIYAPWMSVYLWTEFKHSR